MAQAAKPHVLNEQQVGFFRQKILERVIDNIINRHRPALQFPGRHGKVDSVCWGEGIEAASLSEVR